MGSDTEDEAVNLKGKLATVTAKKESAFAILNSVYDLAQKATTSDTCKTFSNKVHNVEGLKTRVLECIDQINDLNLQIDPAKYKPSFQGVDTVYDMCGYILKKHALIQSIQTKQGDSSKESSQPAVIIQPKIHLPPLDLKVFSGDTTQWPLWYESYKSLIHNNAELTNHQKVQYLVSKLSHSALNVCTGILPTADNYDTIFQALIQKYDDKRTLAMSYLDKLFKFKPMKAESATNLNMFVDHFSGAVAALQNLQIPNLGDFLILALALGKLDPETTKQFEMFVKGTPIPTFEQLDKFVKEQAKLLGRMPNSYVKVDQSPSNSKFSHAKNVSPNHNVTHSFVVEKTKNCCACHKTSHPLFNCEAFLKLSPVQRFDLVKQNKICINCLNTNHIVTACKSNHNCNHCSSRHNTLLHFRDKQVAHQPSCSTEQCPANNTTTSCCT